MMFSSLSFLLVATQLASPVLSGCTISNNICYRDTEKRILGKTDMNVGGGALSLEYCAQICKDHGFKLAGAEDGTQCFCGNELTAGAEKINMSKCNMACNAKGKNEKCGGDYAINVFDVNCNGTPVPKPFPGTANPVLVNPCLNGTFMKMPFCDPTLDIATRVTDALNRMTLKEKEGMLDTGGAPTPSLGIPAYNWWEESSSGVSNRKGAQATKFAFPITTGMSFNRTLWKVTGRQIGREARALMNAGLGGSTFWAPVINLAREPRWGRNLETPGEDPYHSGEYATNFVEGMQEAPEDPYHIQASACCKHYVANSMDGSNEDGVHHDRNHYNANITQQDLVDSYMLPFQACVEKGRVSGLMCSYNAVNGVPSCANDWLLTEVARDDWGFNGYITSDCDADNDVVFSHHYTNIPEQGVQDVLRAGTDVDCGSFVGKYVQSALNKSYITEKDIDERIFNLLMVRFRLGHFDPVGPLQQIPTSAICSDYAIELSQDGPVQSSALLKNSGALPLVPTSAGKVAVIGPTANLSQSDAGYYGPHNVCNGHFWNLVDAVATKAMSVNTTLGVPSVTSNDMSGIPAAVEMAKEADTVVLSVGTDLSWAREGHDASYINFTLAQKALIANVSAAAKKPIVLVLQTATPIDISAELANDKIGAILHVGEPSVTILGVSKLLWGEVSPAGRTVQTFYKASYVDQISIFDFNMRPGPSPFPRPDCGHVQGCPMGTNPGRTYRFYVDTPVVPFGFGLSYTTFTYKITSAPAVNVSLDRVRSMVAQTKQDGLLMPKRETQTSNPLVQYIVEVTNTGKMDADDSVLGFVQPPGAGQNGVPIKNLFGFERVHVKAGETVSVYLYPELSYFTQVSKDGVRQAAAGEYTFQFGVPETVTHGMGYAEHSFTMA